MSSEATEAASLDLSTLLGRAVLRLAPEIRSARSRTDLLALKNEPARGYLVIARDDWPMLERFGSGQTVSQVLCESITENRCPPLRDFYELVVKAYQHGILQAVEDPPLPVVVPAKWPFSIPGPVVRLVGAVVICLSLSVFWREGVQVPAHVLDVAIGILLAGIAASLSQLLAAAVLQGAECEVYRPRFVWKSPSPGFHVDLADAVMGGRETELNVALVRLIPPLLFAAVTAYKAPPYCLPLLCSVYLNLSPIWRSPTLDILRALFRDPRLVSDSAFVLSSNRPRALLSRARQQFSDRKFLLASVVATLAWLAFGFATGCALLQAHAVNLLRRFYVAGGLHYTELAIIGLVAVVVLCLAGLLAWMFFSRVLGWWSERMERRRRMRLPMTSPEAVAEFLAGSVLFRDLPADALQEVAGAMQAVQFARREYVIRMGTQADRLFVVVSGRLEVVRHLTEDKVEAVAEMFPGDLLGEIGMIRGEARSRSIRAAARSVLLALEKPDFERLVLPYISRGDVEEAVLKVGFLQNVDLVKNWSQESLAAFARLAKISEYNAGDVVMQEGVDNLFLHLVHRGEFEVTQRGKRLRRLKQGDSFGEVGMMENNAATVTVVATVPGSCLVVQKTDFLRFITQDFALSLQFEQIGAKRISRKAAKAKKGPGFHTLRG